MAFTKITNQELNSRGATTLPNQPAISATALKAEFDAPAKEVVAPKVNNLIDELEATTAADSLGGVAPTGFTGATVQAILDALATAVKTIQAQQVGASAPSGQTGDNVQALINSLSEQITNINTSITELNGAKHTHSNKSLLDSYDQSNSDIADAVSMKHSHTNKSTLDKLSEDSSGNPTFNGNTIPTTGQVGGFQKYIEHDLIAPSESGTEGDIIIAPSSEGDAQSLYRYESDHWEEIQFGTNVAANPQGEATSRLNKLQIGSSIYSVPQSEHIYSSDEHLVGKWTNGNDVYERSFKLNSLPSNDSAQYQHGIGGIGLVLYTVGTINENNVFTDMSCNNEIKVDSTYITLTTSKAQNGTGHLTIGYTKPTGGYYTNNRFYKTDTGLVCTGWYQSSTKTVAGDCYCGMLVARQTGGPLYWVTFCISKVQATANGMSYRYELQTGSLTYGGETWYYSHDFPQYSASSSSTADATQPVERRYYYGEFTGAFDIEAMLTALLDSIYD